MCLRRIHPGIDGLKRKSDGFFRTGLRLWRDTEANEGDCNLGWQVTIRGNKGGASGVKNREYNWDKIGANFGGNQGKIGYERGTGALQRLRDSVS